MPTTGPITYSIESALTGSVTLNAFSMSSFGAPVSYNATVIGGPVQVTGNTITVAGLNYTATHNVTVMAAVCPGVATNGVPIPISFNTSGIFYIQLIQTIVS